MTYTLEINGPQGYGFTTAALPKHLMLVPYRVLSHKFEPDGKFYEVGEKNPGLYDIPYIKIPTGKLIWELEFYERGN